MVEQKELILLLANQLSIIKTLNILAILAVIVGPISAVIITLWYQSRKQKLETKERIFLTLMAHRKAFPPPQELVNALNLIRVVFANCPKVVSLWHEYYDLLHQIHNWEETQKPREHKYLELLSEMSRCLRYPAIQQTDIDKFYTPRFHGEQYDINLEIQKEWLRVLKNSARFVVYKRDDEESPSQ